MPSFLVLALLASYQSPRSVPSIKVEGVGCGVIKETRICRSRDEVAELFFYGARRKLFDNFYLPEQYSILVRAPAYRRIIELYQKPSEGLNGMVRARVEFRRAGKGMAASNFYSRDFVQCKDAVELIDTTLDLASNRFVVKVAGSGRSYEGTRVWGALRKPDVTLVQLNKAALLARTRAKVCG